MKKLLFFFILSQTLLGQTVTYTESTYLIANPERGLQKYSITASNYATTDGANNLSVATLTDMKNSSDKITVVYRYFMLNEFMNSVINTTYLNNIQTDFNNIRTAGLKVIVRFAYSDVIGTAAQQPSKAQILSHISQLAPVLNTNNDVIFSLQAGFIGTWGEWYYTNSTEFGTDGVISTEQWNNRKEIIDAMLAATPIEIPIQVRYVGIKTTMYGTLQLTPSTAYQNTPNARIGFFNDAFLNNYGDMGTYAVGECENPVGTPDYNYLSNETQYLPMTGETNGLNPCDSGFRTTGANAITEMGLTHWTTLNRDYYPDFWDFITAANYDEMVKKLGYRYVLNSTNVTSNGSNFNLTLNLTNVGFATPFKQRSIYLVLKSTATNTISIHLINADIRTWVGPVSITQNFNLGLTGTFQMYLWMPDKAPSLSANSDYSIQVANTGTWEPTTGYNNLLQTITLDALGVDDFSNNDHFSIYPNPSTDYITIQFSSLENETLQIYNSLGQLVKETIVANNDRVDVSQLASGIYIIRVQQNAPKVLKFIKN